VHELAWFIDPCTRVSFEATARLHHAFFTSTLELVEHTWTYVLTFIIVVPTLGSRAVRILFTEKRPDDPVVHVHDPYSSPHRYSDNSLCMWHPHDPPDQRWCHTDGLPALVGYIQAHLARENWWRRMDEWLGPEAPHERVPTAPSKVVGT
jgi:hypothetical protein